jgi:probable HAF family extracellular repeat protein
MKSRTWMWMTVVSLFAALAMPVWTTAQEQQQQSQLPRYTVTDLATLGGAFGFAQGINNRGWVEGFATLPGDQTQHSFLWADGVKTDLGTLGGPNGGGDFGGDFRPNERGQVPGVAQTSTLDPRGLGCFGFPPSPPYICLPFIWENGVKTVLPTLGGYLGLADAINNRGQVTGSAENTVLDTTCPPQFPFNQFRPVNWRMGKVQELPAVAGDPDGQGFGVNDNGQVVGASGDCLNLYHALLWQNGTVTDLGNLGGTIGNAAFDINNQGQVVGNSALPGNMITHGFLWQNGVMTDLGTLPGDTYSFAPGINNQSEVGGDSCDISFNCRAFIWQNGVMTDLNTLIPPGSPLFLIQARQINSRGEAVGLAFQASTGETHAYLATPCHGNHCEDGAEGTTTAGSAISERPKITLPENVRNTLRQQLARGFSISGQTAAPRD